MVDEPISSSARYRFTASHPQVQHALTSDFRRAYNSSCTLFRDSFIIRNGTRDRSFDLLPPLQPFEGCERSFARVLALRSTIDRHPSLSNILETDFDFYGLIRWDWKRTFYVLELFQDSFEIYVHSLFRDCQSKI